MSFEPQVVKQFRTERIRDLVIKDSKTTGFTPERPLTRNQWFGTVLGRASLSVAQPVNVDNVITIPYAQNIELNLAAANYFKITNITGNATFTFVGAVQQGTSFTLEMNFGNWNPTYDSTVMGDDRIPSNANNKPVMSFPFNVKNLPSIDVTPQNQEDLVFSTLDRGATWNVLGGVGIFDGINLEALETKVGEIGTWFDLQHKNVTDWFDMTEQEILKALDSTWTQLKTWWDGIYPSIDAFFENPWGTLFDALTGVVDGFNKAGKAIEKWAAQDTGIIGIMYDLGKPIWTTIKKISADVWTTIEGIASAVWTGLATAVKNIQDLFANPLVTLANWGATLGKIVTDWLTADTGVLGYVYTQTKSIVESVIEFIKDPWGKLLAAAKSLTSTLTKVGDTIIAWVAQDTGVIGWLYDNFKTAAQATWNVITGIADTVWTGLGNVWDSISKLFRNPDNHNQYGLEYVISNVSSWLSTGVVSILQNASSFGTQVVKNITDKIFAIGQNAQDFFDSMFINELEAIAGGVYTTIESAITGFQNWVTGQASGANTSLSNLVNVALKKPLEWQIGINSGSGGSQSIGYDHLGGLYIKLPAANDIIRFQFSSAFTLDLTAERMKFPRSYGGTISVGEFARTSTGFSFGVPGSTSNSFRSIEIEKLLGESNGVVEQSLIPHTNRSYTLGSSTKLFREAHIWDLYVGDDIKIDGHVFSDFIPSSPTNINTSNYNLGADTSRWHELHVWDIVCYDDLQVIGELNHDGSHVGFYGISPKTRRIVSYANSSNTGVLRERLDDLILKLSQVGIIGVG